VDLCRLLSWAAVFGVARWEA